MRIVVFLIENVKIDAELYVYREIRNWAETIPQICRGADIAFFQVQGRTEGMTGIIEKVRDGGTFTMVYSGDVRESLADWQIEIGKVADLMLFVSGDYVKWCREKDIRADYFHDNYDAEIFKPLNEEKKYDIIFQGHYYPQFPLGQYRMDVCSFLRATYGNNFLCMGRMGNLTDGTNHSDLYNQNLLYNQSKIAINISQVCQSGYSSDRILKAMAAGCFVLTHYYPDMPYIDGKHLRVFNDFETLKKLIDYYLYYDKEREKIAEAGRKKIAKINDRRLFVKQILTLYKKWNYDSKRSV